MKKLEIETRADVVAPDGVTLRSRQDYSPPRLREFGRLGELTMGLGNNAVDALGHQTALSVTVNPLTTL